MILVMDRRFIQYLHGKTLSLSTLEEMGMLHKIQPRMMLASFNGNPCTTVITYYSPSSTSDIIYSCIDIYIYSHPQTDLFRSNRTHQCG